MFAKSLRLSLTFIILIITLLVFPLTRICLADVWSELQQAQSYFENSDYQQAKQIYQGIIKQYSDPDQALEAQKGLVMVYISLGEQAEAETAYQQLLSNFPHNIHMADVIHYGIASHYRKCIRDDKADELDKYVLSHWPSSESAMWAQVDIIGASINRVDYAGAQAGVNNLFASFAKNGHFCDAIHSVAFRYRQSARIFKADELDKYVLSHWPSSESAMWAQVDIINSNIDSKNYATAQTGINNLLARFSGNENMANVLHGMASKYRESEKTARADELDKYVLDHWPSSEIALWAQVDIIKSDIIRGDISPDTAIDELISKFPNYPGLAKMVLQLQVGGSYAMKARLMNLEGNTESIKTFFRKATEMSEQVIREFPDSELTPMAYLVSASCYTDYLLAEYQKAIDYFQIFVDRWPNHEFAGYAQYFIGECYERWMHSEAISESVALPKIEKAYKSFIEKYSQDIQSAGVVESVLLRLGQISLKNGKFPEAIKYFEMLLGKGPDKICLIGSDLSWAYKKMGNAKDASHIQSEVEKNCYPKVFSQEEKSTLEKFTPVMEIVAQELCPVVREASKQEDLAKGVFDFFQNFEHTTGIAFPLSFLPPDWGKNQPELNKVLDLIEEKWLFLPVDDYYDEVGLFLLWGNTIAGRFDKAETLFTEMKGNLRGKNIDTHFNSNPIIESVFKYTMTFCKEPFTSREDLSLLYASKMTIDTYEYQKEWSKYFEVIKLICDNYEGTKGAELLNVIYEVHKVRLKYGSMEAIPEEEKKQLVDNARTAQKGMERICEEGNK